MHKRAATSVRSQGIRSPRPHLTATHLVRAAEWGDAGDVHALLAAHANSGLILPRTFDEVTQALDDCIVVTDQHDRVLASASLIEYSPSLAEVGGVVVAEDAQGQGLGSIAVRAVEAMARRRGVDELFALTTADRFFESLGYVRCAIARYPEKLARYEALARRGVAILPKSCFRKLAL